MGLRLVTSSSLLALALLWAGSWMMSAYMGCLASGLQYPEGALLILHRDYCISWERALDVVRARIKVSGERVLYLVVELKNTGHEDWPSSSFPRFDVIARYTVDEDLTCTATWLPYDPSLAGLALGTETGWFISPKYDPLNPLDPQEGTGVWDPGEVIELYVTFKPEDRPYYNVTSSAGYLTLVIRPIGHPLIVINLKSPTIEVAN